MKLVILKSKNGWLVCQIGTNDDIPVSISIRTDGPKVATFNSLEKAISYIRSTIKSWHEQPSAQQTTTTK